DDLFQLDHAHVAARLELPVLVQDEGDPAGHPGREVPSGPAEDHDHPAGHVLAAVIAGAFDDSPRAAVADGKALAGCSVEVALALRGPVEGGVADQDGLFGHERGALGRVDDDPSAAQALAEVVVGLALEFQRHASGQEGAERLAGRARELDVDRVGRQPFQPIALGDLAGEDRSDGPVHVADGEVQPNRLFALDRRLAQLDELPVDGPVQSVVLFLDTVPGDIRSDLGLGQDRGEVEALRLPVVDRLLGPELVRPSDHLCELSEAHLRHPLAYFLGHKEEVVDDMLRLAGELGMEHRVVGGVTHRTGVDVALAYYGDAYD